MRVGIFCTLDHHDEDGVSPRQSYERALGEAELAEELGLESFWITEHHFSTYGICPDPAVLLAAMSQRTRRLRLGTATAVLPFDQPLRLAESYALLDQISGGRLELGVGSGYLRHEFEGFGLDPEARRERFDETLAILRQAWAGEPVLHQGRLLQVRAPSLNVRPLQAGGPPLHIGITRAAAAPYVGRQALALATVPYISLGSAAQLGALISAYRAALPSGTRGGVTAALHAFCSTGPNDPDLFRAREALARYLRTRVVPGARYAGTPPAEDFVLFGPADALLARLRALGDLGVDRVLLLTSFGGLAPELVAASLARLAPRLGQLGA